MSDILSEVADDLEGDEGESPFLYEYGVVHEVDLHTLAVKAVIPSIDPDRVHDSWIQQAVPWMGPAGYGPVFAPAVGSEVLITGRFGQSFSLFYLSVFNERYTVPGEFADGSRGLKNDTPLRLLCDQLIEIVGGQRVLLEAAQQADLKGQAVRLFSGNTEMFRVEGESAGFRGAAIARRALPTPGPTDTPLTVAIRQLLIDLRLAQ